jgi:Kef-type K+ transport system membrane component KefB
VLYLAGLIVAIAIITKLIGCGIPSMIFLKDKSQAMKVGIGMISRGQSGLRMKATVCICFQIMALIPTGMRTW